MNFEDMNLNENVLKSIKLLGYKQPTPIQAKSIPLIKAGRDVTGQSLTGSGKTAAFGIPMIEKVQPGKGLQALILTPTRELCQQVAKAIYDIGKYSKPMVVSVYGGVGMQPQVDALKKADIVVGTPGRILDHLNRRTVNFSGVKTLVIDEADKMFEMGFVEDVEQIIMSTPKDRQTMLFSATFSDQVMSLVKNHLRNPAKVVEQARVDKSLLRQVYYNVSMKDKFSLLVHFLKNKTPGLAIVFCGTRHEVDIITKNLKAQKLDAMAIHGGLSQNKRTYAIDQIKKAGVSVLVATDVAARGLDIQDISHIYNYDVPKTPEDYVHRIGRTARAGKRGDAVTLLTERDYENFNRVLRDSSLVIKKEDIPPFERVAFQTGRTEGGGRFQRGGFRGGFRGGGSGGFHGGSRGPREGGHRSGGGHQGGRREGGFSHPRRSEGSRESYRPPRFGSAG